MRSLPVQYERRSFLDFGSGKGRMVIAAATLPFRRVLGVEISDRLLQEARRNVEAMREGGRPWWSSCRRMPRRSRCRPT